MQEFVHRGDRLMRPEPIVIGEKLAKEIRSLNTYDW